MVAPNEKHPDIQKLMAVLKRESLMLSVESQERLLEAALRPTVFVAVRRGETVTRKDVAVHKV